MFDDNTGVTFNTAFRTDYGFGTYLYEGKCHNCLDEYNIPYVRCGIEWLSQASQSSGVDQWKLYFYF